MEIDKDAQQNHPKMGLGDIYKYLHHCQLVSINIGRPKSARSQDIFVNKNYLGKIIFFYFNNLIYEFTN